MSIRVFALAKELNVDKNLVMEWCNQNNLSIKGGSALAIISDEDAVKVREHFTKGTARPSRTPIADTPRPVEPPKGLVSGRVPTLPSKPRRTEKAETPKADTPKADVSNVETLKVETPKADTPKAETPKVETPKAETPKAETPKAETPKAETLKAETPKAETPKAETPKAETPKAETPKTSESVSSEGILPQDKSENAAAFASADASVEPQSGSIDTQISENTQEIDVKSPSSGTAESVQNVSDGGPASSETVSETVLPERSENASDIPQEMKSAGDAEDARTERSEEKRTAAGTRPLSKDGRKSVKDGMG